MVSVSTSKEKMFVKFLINMISKHLVFILVPSRAGFSGAEKPAREVGGGSAGSFASEEDSGLRPYIPQEVSLEMKGSE